MLGLPVASDDQARFPLVEDILFRVEIYLIFALKIFAFSISFGAGAITILYLSPKIDFISLIRSEK